MLTSSFRRAFAAVLVSFAWMWPAYAAAPTSLPLAEVGGSEESGLERDGSRRWPVTMVAQFEGHDVMGVPEGSIDASGPHITTVRFRGRSWIDWETEILTGELAGYCSKRTPERFFDGFNGCDGVLHDVGAESPLVPYGPSYYLRGGTPSDWTGPDNRPLSPAAVPEYREPPGSEVAFYQGSVQRAETRGHDTQIAAFDLRSGWLLYAEQQIEGVRWERFQVKSIEFDS